ncbi:MAG: hypothetical protein IKS08_01155 [Alphaproteobacteria bacterium]|nr:hypothetical protein [Alphaproteobacteria bacterium]
MRMFLLFFLLILPITTNASTCSSFNNPEDSDGCINAEGCYWDGTDCLSCPAADANQGYYCPEGAHCNSTGDSPTGRCTCPDDFPWSTVGNTSADNCYKPCSDNSDDGNAPQNCGITKGNSTNVSCKDEGYHITAGNPSADYHLEGSNECRLNARPCNLFSAKDESSNPINAALITGTAIWLPTEQKYQVSDTNNADNTCTYSVTGIQYADKHCTANITYTNNTQWVANASSELNFQTVNGYYCTSCINTYPTYYYYPSSNTDVDDCVNPGNNHSQVCLCKIVPRGYYLNGIWNYTSPISSNRYTKCPVGQTTMNGTSPNYSGGGSIDDCQYEDDTQVCDVAGCKSLNQILSGAAANTWTSMLN